ncbi:HvfC family RiPP maturation protein [Pseudoalteromonas tunicata]|uniref:Uncharacterized protein n=1 Tax=Pseudoalteromonas tunicata D2 TaxID=87626 RepID=A4C5Q2_9GAMM|nr:putative DNA-binding domain-containing protein [Pseudoalteromonas tunicata]ATC95281.1 hypothetical protein PTUN_a2873 [Pseudoalteromonas tunicata]AXT30882.1 DUF2063 domain-containing protein [Pseudoalteromonas tunicata]EAR29306.1 hypothetical protein PTD2_10839 [Pseudoalteromonas tunicata D2]MDP4985389.1 putative DNA-binding domain-containing protein [Pseudoalteromonas tunicata]MDP5213126.1 putative DNA-binding domain-containing protein [Pseudoalteromonas tunicata]
MTNFKLIQQQFMAHIRNPEHQPAPEGIEDRRLNIYRELFFNNVEGFLASGFPVLKSLYSTPEWHQLVRAFFSTHQCESPYFLHIAQEFLDFLSQEYQLLPSDPVFLIELAHYEWVELALSIEAADESERPLSGEQIDTHPLYLSHLAWNLSYQYPVQFISAQNNDPEPVAQGNYIVVYRDGDDEIQFLAINVMTALLLQQLQQQPGIGFTDLCEQLASQATQLPINVIQTGAKQILTQLLGCKIVVTR